MHVTMTKKKTSLHWLGLNKADSLWLSLLDELLEKTHTGPDSALVKPSRTLLGSDMRLRTRTVPSTAPR